MSEKEVRKMAKKKEKKGIRAKPSVEETIEHDSSDDDVASVHSKESYESIESDSDDDAINFTEPSASDSVEVAEEKQPEALEKNETVIGPRMPKRRAEVFVDEKTSRQRRGLRHTYKKVCDNIAHKQPDIAADQALETRLRKTATRGFVQLLNAINERQNTVNKVLNDSSVKSIFKRERVREELRQQGSKSFLKTQKINDDDAKEEVKPKKKKKSWLSDDLSDALKASVAANGSDVDE